jgi:hypothetical protein
MPLIRRTVYKKKGFGPEPLLARSAGELRLASLVPSFAELS